MEQQEHVARAGSAGRRPLSVSRLVAVQRTAADEPVDDAELLRRASRGDQSAWSDLVQRYAHVVWAGAQRTGSASTAVLVSETVWLRLAQVVPDVGPAGVEWWLRREVRVEAQRAVRLRKSSQGRPD